MKDQRAFPSPCAVLQPSLQPQTLISELLRNPRGNASSSMQKLCPLGSCSVPAVLSLHADVQSCVICFSAPLPDKNQHRKEEAEERFKDISNAYEVLSDPHERAWYVYTLPRLLLSPDDAVHGTPRGHCVCLRRLRYDGHREAILRSGERHQTGASGGDFAGGQKPDSEPDLFQFFSSSAFSGYNDGPRVRRPKGNDPL